MLYKLFKFELSMKMSLTNTLSFLVPNISCIIKNYFALIVNHANYYDN